MMKDREPLLLHDLQPEEKHDNLEESSEDIDALNSIPYVPSRLTVKFMSIFGAALLLPAAFLDISFPGVVYLMAGLLYLSFYSSPALNFGFLSYSCIMFLGKAILMLVLFCSHSFDHVSSLAKDIYSSFGISFLDKSYSKCALALLSDALAILALLIVKNFLVRAKSPKSYQSARLTQGKIWCWLSLCCMAVAYILGDSLIYAVISIVLVMILVCWAGKLSMERQIFARSSGGILGLSAILAVLQYMAQTRLAGHLPERWARISGMYRISTFRDWTAFASLLGIYVCVAFYHRSFLNDTPQPRIVPQIITQIEPPSNINSSGDENSSVSKKDSRENLGAAQNSIAFTAKNWLLTFWKQIIWTPFGLLHIVRIIAVFWILKYNMVFSVPVIVWVYYSVWFTDVKLFCRVSPFLIIPWVALQLVGSKIACVPRLIPEDWKFYEYLSAFGMFQFSKQGNLTAVFEFSCILVFFLLICAAYNLRQFMGRYERWEAKNVALAAGKRKNSLEIAVHFVFSHVEKLYAVLLYIVAFSKVNVGHTLILLFMVLFAVANKFARNHFVLIVFILFYRALFRYIVLLGYLFGCTYPPSATHAFIIFGIDVKFDPTRMTSKVDIDWELILMLFCSYLQLRIIRYINSEPPGPAEGDPNHHNRFVTFFVRLGDFLEKFLLWAVYLVLFLILAYEDPTLVIVLDSVLLVILFSVHVYCDLSGESYRGYEKTMSMWYVLIIVNLLILSVSYVFCFMVYTVRIETSSKDFDEYASLLKILGFDLVPPTGMRLQLNFLPLFAILYLSLLSQHHIRARRFAQRNLVPNPEIEYSSPCWTFCLLLLDVSCRYSFHLLFFIAAVLGIFWSLNGMMLVYISIFAIHYSVLHLRYIRGRTSTDATHHTYTEKAAIIVREEAFQSQQATEQRRRTLKILTAFTCAILLFCQFSRIVLPYKHYVDIYKSGSERMDLLYLSDVLQAIYISFFDSVLGSRYLSGSDRN